jgi:ribosome maturation factor RimP
MNQQQGTVSVPFLFVPMATEAQLTKIKELITELLQPTPDIFLVQVKVKPTNNIKIFLDGDQGVTIDACTKLNRALYKQIEELQFFPDDDFSLEVSSAGVGEPLQMNRQYTKNIGRNLLVVPVEGIELEGELKEVSDAEIVIETITGKGKKAETKQHIIPFQNIKAATVQIKF